MSKTDRCLIIAEAGVNHNGDLKLALELVHAAAEAGADLVKFQTFNADSLVTKTAGMATYQKKNIGGGDTQWQMLKRLEVSKETHWAIAEACEKAGIGFFSTAFEAGSLKFLAEDMKLSRFKIPSGEVTNGPLVLAHARYGRPMIVSTGMCTLGEVETALGVIAFGLTASDDAAPSREAFQASFTSEKGQVALKAKVTLLHCTSQYPTPVEAVNLRAMQTMASAFGLDVGYSDHTLGTAVSVAAAALGARVIEKHFTLDRSLPGPDHAASLEPNELKRMVEEIRQVEEALGSGVKAPDSAEMETRTVARKSLVALRSIAVGEPFTEDNVGAKRPGGGLSPMMLWDILSRRARRAMAEGEALSPERDFDPHAE